MRTLVIYFSYSGNNQLLAEHLSKLIPCDLCPIIEKKRRTMLTIILDMFFKRKPKIEDLEVAISSYDHIILVAPIWDSKIANPMKSLIRIAKDSISEYSFITLCGYERSEQKETINNELINLLEQNPKAILELKICELLPAAQQDQIKTISRYKVQTQDLAHFELPISEFLKQIGIDS